MKKVLCLFVCVVVLAFPVAFAQSTNSNDSAKISEVSKILAVADILSARKSFDAALAEYRQALTLTPNDYSIHNKMGICYQRMTNLGAAKKEYEISRKLNPAFAEVVNNLGTVYYMSHSYKQAIKLYKKAADMKPELATPYCNMGAAFFEMRKFKNGFEAYQKAIALDPSILEHSAANGISVRTAAGVTGLQYFYFAKLSAANGQIDQAFNYLTKAQEYGYKDFSKITQDPDFKALVEDARFEQFMKSNQAKL
jgi:tetratricopeptide (TPR) repeat protein